MKLWLIFLRKGINGNDCFNVVVVYEIRFDDFGCEFVKLWLVFIRKDIDEGNCFDLGVDVTAITIKDGFDAVCEVIWVPITSIFKYLFTFF